MYLINTGMFFLFICKCLGLVIAGAFGLVCFAQGLIYIAGFVEEHSQVAKRVVKTLLLSECVLHLCLMFDSDVAFFPVLVGLLAHIVYCSLLPQFPFVSVTSPIAIASVAVALVNHLVWLVHFVKSEDYFYPLSTMAAIFVVCTWCTPLVLVVSLSTMDALPISATHQGTPDAPAQRRNLVSAFFRYIGAKRDQLLPLFSQ